MEFLNILKCQQCLNDLELLDSTLYCNNCKKSFEYKNDIIFMGYDETEENEINKIISVESNFLTNLNEMEKYYNFAKFSFNLSNIVIKILKLDTNIQNPVAVDIGCGGAPMSKMLSDAGFDTYRCELDPNSLYSGLIFRHKNLGLGKHIACDSKYLPFANNSLDLVFCKDFAHHVHDCNSLFNEINRVLKHGGIFCLIEPTLSIRGRLVRLFIINDYFGHHYQTIYQYFKILETSHFLPYRYFLFYDLPVLNRLNKRIKSKRKTSFLDIRLKKIIQYTISSKNIIISKKIKNTTNLMKRPKIRCISPSLLKLDESFLKDPRWVKLNEVLMECTDHEIK